MNRKATFGVVMAVCVLLYVGGPAPGGVAILAYTGQAAPDGNGSYSTFTDPVLNHFGRLAFRADLTGTALGTDDDTAIFRVDSTAATVICHENWFTPDLNGRFRYLYTPAMNNASQVSFRADASNTLLGGYDAVGIYRGFGGVPDQLVRGNDPAPDGNGRFFIMSDTPLLDDDARTSFWASFTGTAGGVNDSTAIVMDWIDGPKIFVRADQLAPGGDGRFFGFGDIAANQDQSIAFEGELRSTSGGTDNNMGIFHARPTYPVITVSELVREGDAPPDGNGEYWYFSLSPTLNDVDHGRAAFRAVLRNTSAGTDDDSGVFLATGTSVVRIAREGQPPPDGNGQYSTFDAHVAQNDAWVAFAAVMRNTAGEPVDQEGLYRGYGLMTTKIARGGEPAPDGNGVFRFFDVPVMNEPGHVAFQAQLIGTAGGSSDNKGIFIGNGGDVVQVARTGQTLLGSTIVELHLAAGSDCRNGLNNLAQVAYRAVLDDGREALVLYSLLLKWIGGPTGKWDTNANWPLAIVPVEHYDVAITPIGSVDVAGPRSDATVKSLTIGSTGGGMAALNLTSGGGLTALEDIIIGGDGRILVGAGRTLSAAALLNGGTLAFESGQTHVIGDVTNTPVGEMRLVPTATVWLHDRVQNQGLMDVPAGATVYLHDLAGNGCSGAGTARIEGCLRPGTSVGFMAFGGDLVFGPRCVTYLDLGGTTPGSEHDQVNVAGEATLDGTLACHLIDGFRPAVGDEFNVLTYGSHQGRFQQVQGWQLGDLALVQLYHPDHLLLHATYFGDATLDHCVDGLDYNRWSLHYLQPADFTDGDFNGDGTADGLDYNLWSLNYLRGCDGAAIPEPACALLVLLASPAILRRRTRRAEDQMRNIE